MCFFQRTDKILEQFKQIKKKKSVVMNYQICILSCFKCKKVLDVIKSISCKPKIIKLENGMNYFIKNMITLQFQKIIILYYIHQKPIYFSF